jgi:hypothetical protein
MPNIKFRHLFVAAFTTLLFAGSNPFAVGARADEQRATPPSREVDLRIGDESRGRPNIRADINGATYNVATTFGATYNRPAILIA